MLFCTLSVVLPALLLVMSAQARRIQNKGLALDTTGPDHGFTFSFSINAKLFNSIVEKEIPIIIKSLSSFEAPEELSQLDLSKASMRPLKQTRQNSIVHHISNVMIMRWRFDLHMMWTLTKCCIELAHLELKPARAQGIPESLVVRLASSVLKFMEAKKAARFSRHFCISTGKHDGKEMGAATEKLDATLIAMSVDAYGTLTCVVQVQQAGAAVIVNGGNPVPDPAPFLGGDAAQKLFAQKLFRGAAKYIPDVRDTKRAVIWVDPERIFPLLSAKSASSIFLSLAVRFVRGQRLVVIPDSVATTAFNTLLRFSGFGTSALQKFGMAVVDNSLVNNSTWHKSGLPQILEAATGSLEGEGALLFEKGGMFMVFDLTNEERSVLETFFESGELANLLRLPVGEDLLFEARPKGKSPIQPEKCFVPRMYQY